MSKVWSKKSATKFLKMMIFGLFTQRSILVPYAFVWEHTQIVDYSVLFEVYDINVDVYSKLNEYREIYMYQRSRAFFDLCPVSLICH